MRRLAVFAMLIGCHPAAKAPEVWATDTDATWRAMQHALDGHWRATTAENRTIDVTYHAVSNGSALVESFRTPSGRETLTVYHHDGPRLMLTHYCAQGNQARLKAIEATPARVTFAFFDATNVSADQDVMHRLVFAFHPDGFDQESTYRTTSGADETTTLHFVRAD